MSITPSILFTTALAGALLSSTAWSATDIQLWYSLNKHNSKSFKQLVKAFNKEHRGEIQLKTQAFETEEDLDAALSLASEEERPNIVQLPEVSGMDDVATRSYIWPLHQALAYTKTSIANDWFLPAANNFMHSSGGQLLALPFMAEIPVMYYNTDAFKKAGIKPEEPSRAWHELQDQLLSLASKGSKRCPLTSDQPVSINLENLAAVNKQFYLGNGNPQGGFNFDSMYIRHLSTMISWVRSEIMVHPSMGPQSPTRFGKGECAVFLSNSGNIGQFSAYRTLDFAISGIPYYPQVTAEPGNPFVTGSGLWLTRGHNAEKDHASTAFISWLAQTDQAAKWYQQTGFLPLTQAAFNATDNKYYAKLGQWRELVAQYSKAPENTTRGFKVNNYHQIRAVFNDSLTHALEGKQPAVTALKNAAAEANKLMQQK